jgi:hypothetical protein
VVSVWLPEERVTPPWSVRSRAFGGASFWRSDSQRTGTGEAAEDHGSSDALRKAGCPPDLLRIPAESRPIEPSREARNPRIQA